MTAPPIGTAPADRPWFIATREHQYLAEGRANLLRAVAVVLFYAVEVVRHQGLPLEWAGLAPAEGGELFHRAASVLAGVWIGAVAVLAWLLHERYFPRWLPYASAAADLVLLTALLLLGSGPRSPLLPAYFVVLALAALRADLPLLWFTGGGAALGYLSLLVYARHFAPERGLTVPRFQQALFLLALLLTAVVLGQLVRQTRQLAAEFARRTAPAGGSR